MQSKQPHDPPVETLSKRGGDPVARELRGTRAVALTGDGGAVALRVQHHQFVLQAAAAHALGTNQNQRLPPEGWDLGHLFVYPQLVAVELCAIEERAEPLSDSLTQQRL